MRLAMKAVLEEIFIYLKECDFRPLFLGLGAVFFLTLLVALFLLFF
jgi:hypothetical protein